MQWTIIRKKLANYNGCRFNVREEARGAEVTYIWALSDRPTARETGMDLRQRIMGARVEAGTSSELRTSTVQNACRVHSGSGS